MSGTFTAYHLATLADFCDVGAIFAQQHEYRIGLPEAKAERETRVVGAARAVANAVRRATGRRARARPAKPITLVKLPA